MFISRDHFAVAANSNLFVFKISDDKVSLVRRYIGAQGNDLDFMAGAGIVDKYFWIATVLAREPNEPGVKRKLRFELFQLSDLISEEQ